MVYMALLATEAGLRDNTQISITAITDKIHGMTGRAVRIISKAVVAIFSESAFFHPLPFLKNTAVFRAGITWFTSAHGHTLLCIDPQLWNHYRNTGSSAGLPGYGKKAAEDQGKEDAS